MLVISGAEDEIFVLFLLPVEAQVAATGGTDGLGDYFTGDVEAFGGHHDVFRFHLFACELPP